MPVILEVDIIQAYMSGDINEYDIAESYYRNKAKESLRKAREHGDKIDPKGAERRKESMKTIAKANKK